MFKRLLFMTLALVIMLGMGTSVFATKNSDFGLLKKEFENQPLNQIHPDSEVVNINLNVGNEEKIYIQDKSDTSLITPMGPLYEYFWAISSKSKVRMDFGSWRDGPSGKGPANLSINQATNLDRSFTASLTGEYPVGKGTIEASLGITIGTSKSYGTTYDIDIPSDTIRTIIYRPKIDVYEVTQTYYRMNSITGELTSMDKKVATVEAFNNWDYSWRNGY